MSLRSDDFTRAVARIDQLVGENLATRKAYNRLALALPPLLSTNGLSQTVAYLQEKDDIAANVILCDIASIVGVDQKQLLEHAIASDFTRATFDLWRLQNAWAYQRRYAEAVLGATTGEE